MMQHQDNRFDRYPTANDYCQTVQYVRDNYPKYSKPELRNWLNIREKL